MDVSQFATCMISKLKPIELYQRAYCREEGDFIPTHFTKVFALIQALFKFICQIRNELRSRWKYFLFLNFQIVLRAVICDASTEKQENPGRLHPGGRESTEWCTGGRGPARAGSLQG